MWRGELHASSAMIGLLETKEGRCLVHPHSKLHQQRRRSLQAFWKLFYPQMLRASLAALRPASASVCLSAGCRLAFRHDTDDFCRVHAPSLPDPARPANPESRSLILGCRTAEGFETQPQGWSSSERAYLDDYIHSDEHAIRSPAVR
jgi:hypothetical protein